MNKDLQKGFAMPLIIAIVSVVLVSVGVVYYTNQSKEADKMAEEKAMTEKKAMEQKEKDAMMEKYTGTVLAGKSASLLDFVKADYDAAIKTDKLVVLYFYANWCPICKAEVSSALYPVFNELTTDKVIGFRVSYNDNETDNNERSLAKEFGVAYQHTKVFVKNGQRILKSPESWDKKRYDTEIGKALVQ